jgi:methylglutaconyl-CoA hydratase
MTNDTPVTQTLHGRVLTITLNRPDTHNAMTPAIVAELTRVFSELARGTEARVVVLTGRGRSFCAGADLTAMRAAADYTFEQNLADGHAIFDLMAAIDGCSLPVVGRVNGAAIGGGAGLVSCCDIAVAGAGATFGFSETRLGIVPAVISPFVIARIGPRHARELFLTGERFDAAHAQAIGLVNHVVDDAELDDAIAERVDALLMAAPEAQATAKELIRTIAYRPPASVRDYTAETIARRRASDEGREGMTAFLEKRKPRWREDCD